MMRPVIVPLVPRKLADLLFRSFDAKDAFVAQVDEVRRTYPSRPLAFAIVSGGFIEFLAIRRFLSERFGSDFAPQYASRMPALLVEPVGLILRRIASFFGLASKVPSRIFLCSQDLKAGRSVLLNFETLDRKRLYETPWGERDIAYLQEHNPDLIIVPVVIIWRRKRRKEAGGVGSLPTKIVKGIAAPFGSVWNLFLGDPFQPKGLRKIAIMLRQYSRSTLRTIDPVEINQNSARSVRRRIMSSIAQEKKVIIGPVYKSTRLIGEDVLRNHGFLKFVENLAAAENTAESTLFRRAEAYFREMSARYSYFVVEASCFFLTKIFSTIFDEITSEEEDFQKLRANGKEGSIVFMPCHKSYVDFLLLSHLLFTKEINPPHIAAGINMNFWPMGHVFKGGGGFFIRRTFRGNLLYGEVLRRYIAALLANRINLEFFVEGARSRTGKLAPPKYGILKMITDSKFDGLIQEKIIIQPVSISYDRVTEDRAHKRELEGGEKVQETALGVVKSGRVLFRSYGKVHVRFGEAFSFDDWMKDLVGEGTQSHDTRKLAIQKMAFEVLHRINRVTPLTSTGLVCLVLLAKPGAALPASELEALLLRVKDDVAKLGGQLTRDLQLNFADECRKAIKSLLRDGILEEYRSTNDSLGYRVPHKQRVAALYYKNSAVHAFVDAAMAGIAGRDTQDILNLRTLLRFEYFFAERETSVKRIRAVPSEALTGLYAFILDDNLETIQLGLMALLEMRDETLSEKEWKNRLMAFGRAKSLESAVLRLESVNTQSFAAFLELAKNLDWIAKVKNAKGDDALKTSDIASIEEHLVKVRSFRQRIGTWDSFRSTEAFPKETFEPSART